MKNDIPNIASHFHISDPTVNPPGKTTFKKPNLIRVKVISSYNTCSENKSQQAEKHLSFSTKNF